MNILNTATKRVVMGLGIILIAAIGREYLFLVAVGTGLAIASWGMMTWPKNEDRKIKVPKIKVLLRPPKGRKRD